MENEADLAGALTHLRELSARAGRSTPLDVCASPFELAYGAKELPAAGALVETARRLAGLGVTWLILAPPRGRAPSSSKACGGSAARCWRSCAEEGA